MIPSSSIIVAVVGAVALVLACSIITGLWDYLALRRKKKSKKK